MNRNKRGNFSFARVGIYLFAALIIAVYGYYVSLGYTVEENTVEMHFIDVGQGDCSLIISNDGAVLIDTGLTEYSDTVAAYINRYTDTIDCFIATHPDSDHIGGAGNIISRFDVKKVIMSDALSDNTAYDMMLQSIERSDAEVIQAKAGDMYSIGGFCMTVLAPLTDYDESISSNDHSIVVRVEYGDFSAIFTGDAEEEEENQIISAYSSDILKSNLLKVGHHGSKSSTSEAFLSCVSPEIAVISCGVNNEYGHPHKTTLDKLNGIGAEILRTDISGTVIVVTDGKSWYIK